MFGGIVPLANAKPVVVQLTISGSSAMWQSLALAAYQEAGAGAGHWTSASNVANLVDTRVTPNNVDAGTLWIVWNSAVTKVWSFNKVDAVVGTRCYFAQPSCTSIVGSASLTGTGANQISSAFWGADSALPAAIAAVFTAGTLVNAAATVYRPEDALFLTCRTNSQLGAGSYGGAASDELDGLGYNTVNAPGVCPANGLGQASGAYVGNPIKSGYPGSTAQANVLAFNISGVDPISGDTIPSYNVLNFGATPLIFFTERNIGPLASLTNATPTQLQQVFSGANCDASAFGLAAGAINIFINEPISGQGNVAEATVFRRPTVYTGTGTGSVLGLSQESNVGANNPLAGQSGTCLSRSRRTSSRHWLQRGGKVGPKLFREIPVDWTASATASSATATTARSPIAPLTVTSNWTMSTRSSRFGPECTARLRPRSARYRRYYTGCCQSARCLLWRFPLPGKRNLDRRTLVPQPPQWHLQAWTVLRLVSNGKGKVAANDSGQDIAGLCCLLRARLRSVCKDDSGSAYPTDPGLTYLRSHYQQYDGGGNLIGAAPHNAGTDRSWRRPGRLHPQG